MISDGQRALQHSRLGVGPRGRSRPLRVGSKTRSRVQLRSIQVRTEFWHPTGCRACPCLRCTHRLPSRGRECARSTCVEPMKALDPDGSGRGQRPTCSASQRRFRTWASACSACGVRKFVRYITKHSICRQDRVYAPHTNLRTPPRNAFRPSRSSLPTTPPICPSGGSARESSLRPTVCPGSSPDVLAD